MNFLPIIVPAMLSYFFNNIQFFIFADEILDRKVTGKYIYFLTFFINYVMFFLVSILGFHLIINWTFFLIAVFLEMLLFYRCSFLKAFFMSLVFTLVSLALNIFFRCGIAILWNQPLSVFDNNVLGAQNLKQYPLLLCFLLTGVFFLYLRKSKYLKTMQLYMKDHVGLKFNTLVLIILYGFLVLNLLAYYTEGNNLFTKLWGIKSVILIAFFLYGGHQYTMRLNQMNQCRREYAYAQKELLDKKSEDERIRILAFTDPMSGFYNRQFAEEMFDQRIEDISDYIVCFIDLDGLKTVNDNLGHLAGDAYIVKTSEVLKLFLSTDSTTFIRGGGDEFIILINGIDVTEVKYRLDLAMASLEKAGTENNCRYAFSYGIAEGGESSHIRDIVRLADQRMYTNKKSKRA